MNSAQHQDFRVLRRATSPVAVVPLNNPTATIGIG